MIKEANPAGENSHLMLAEVIKAANTLHNPFMTKSHFRIRSDLLLPKINAIKMNDNPTPPQPYISSAQANEPGLAMLKTARTVAVSGGLFAAK